MEEEGEDVVGELVYHSLVRGVGIGGEVARLIGLMISVSRVLWRFSLLLLIVVF